MNDAVLNNFQMIADAMIGDQDTSWAVCARKDIGGVEFVSVIAFGYTRDRAERAAKCYAGGFAAKTDDVLKSRREGGRNATR